MRTSVCFRSMSSYVQWLFRERNWLHSVQLGLLVHLDNEAWRHARRLASVWNVAVGAWCAGRTAGAGARTVPRQVRMRLANPADVIASLASHDQCTRWFLLDLLPVQVVEDLARSRMSSISPQVGHRMKWSRSFSGDQPSGFPSRNIMRHPAAAMRAAYQTALWRWQQRSPAMGTKLPHLCPQRAGPARRPRRKWHHATILRPD